MFGLLERVNMEIKNTLVSMAFAMRKENYLH